MKKVQNIHTENQEIKYIKFITEYEHEGKKYGCEIFAVNEESAKRQLESKIKTEKIVGYIPPDCKDCEWEGVFKV